MRDASQSPRTAGGKHLSSPRPCLPEPLSLPFPPSAPLARGAFFPLFSPTSSPWAPLCPTTSSLLSSRKAKPNSCIRKKSVSGRWFPDLFTHRHRIRGHRTLQLCLPSPLGVWGPMGFCAGRTCLAGGGGAGRSALHGWERPARGCGEAGRTGTQAPSCPASPDRLWHRGRWPPAQRPASACVCWRSASCSCPACIPVGLPCAPLLSRACRVEKSRYM